MKPRCTCNQTGCPQCALQRQQTISMPRDGPEASQVDIGWQYKSFSVPIELPARPIHALLGKIHAEFGTN